QIVDQIDTEIRTMSYLLHPPLLDENGLCGAVRWYARGLRERGGLAITVDISDDFPRLPNDMEVALVRIIQECLTHIHRHAECKTATIRLHCGDDGAHLEVSDDGCGSAAGKSGLRQKTGVGITGMRERVRAFAGSMNIESSDPGNTVTVLLPLPRETECDGSAAARSATVPVQASRRAPLGGSHDDRIGRSTDRYPSESIRTLARGFAPAGNV